MEDEEQMNPKKSRSKREQKNLFIKIAGTAALVLILIAGWLLSKDFRFNRYENKKAGFAMNYPASWEKEENKNGAVVLFYSPVENELDYFKENVNVVIQDISGDLMDLDKYSQKAIDQMIAVFGDNLTIIEAKPVFLDNRTAFKFVFLGKTPETELKYMSHWMIRGNTAYQITYTSLASQFDRYATKVNLMVKSFRLL